MPENKDYLTHEETLGTIQISEDVVASIATSTALEVEGVGGSAQHEYVRLSRRQEDDRARRARGDGGGRHRGEPVHHAALRLRPWLRIAEKVQTAVFSALEGMTGFAVKAVNVHVGGITFD